MIAIAVGYWMGARSTTRGIFVESEALDLGTIWAQKEYRHSFAIHNSTGRTTEIVEFRSSCNCTSIEPKSLVIPSGQSREVRLIVDLTSRLKGVESRTEDERTFDLVAFFAGDSAPIKWRLRANVRDSIISSASVLNFGEITIPADSSAMREVDIDCAREIADLVAQCPRAFARVELIPEEQGRRLRYRLRVVPNSALHLGPFAFDVEFHVTPKVGQAFQSNPLAVRGIVVDDVESIPSGAQFGAVAVGRLLRSTIILRSRSRTPFVFESLDTSGDGLTATSSVEGSSDVHTFALQQYITHKGAQSGRVRIALRSGDGPSRHVEIPVTYYGVSGSL